VITIILHFAVYLLQIRSSNLYSGAMRSRDHRRRAHVCLGSYANEPTSCYKSGA